MCYCKCRLKDATLEVEGKADMKVLKARVSCSLADGQPLYGDLDTTGNTFHGSLNVPMALAHPAQVTVIVDIEQHEQVIHHCFGPDNKWCDCSLQGEGPTSHTGCGKEGCPPAK